MNNIQIFWKFRGFSLKKLIKDNLIITYMIIYNSKGENDKQKKLNYIYRIFDNYVNYFSNILKIKDLNLDQIICSKNGGINYEDHYQNEKKILFGTNSAEIKNCSKKVNELIEKYPILACIKDQLSNNNTYEIFKSFDKKIESIDAKFKD